MCSTFLKNVRSPADSLEVPSVGARWFDSRSGGISDQPRHGGAAWRGEAMAVVPQEVAMAPQWKRSEDRFQRNGWVKATDQSPVRRLLPTC